MLPLEGAEEALILSEVKKGGGGGGGDPGVPGRQRDGGDTEWTAHDGQTGKLLGLFPNRQDAANSAVIAWFKWKVPLFSPDTSEYTDPYTDPYTDRIRIRD